MQHSQSLDAIKSPHTLAQIEEKLRATLIGFSFKTSESYYRGSHLDGKNDKGTQFSLEDQGTADHVAIDVAANNDKPDLNALRDYYGFNLHVEGEDKVDVDHTFNTIVAALK